LVTSTLLIGILLSTLCQSSFANETDEDISTEENEMTLGERMDNDPNVSIEEKWQYQLDEFDKIDAKIRENGIESTEKDPNITRRITGTYPRRKGAILVTKDGKYGELIGHAGIVYDEDTTVESFGKGAPWKPAKDDGVQLYKNNWDIKKKTVYGLGVRVTTKAIDEKAAQWCWNKIGTHYNWNVFDTERVDKLYCSQLVYRAYKAEANINLNYNGGIVRPMDLVNSNLTHIIYTKGIY
ncbi:MAG: hypothetical protein LBR30_02580, partial [Clostridioides sp.]|nr:hypothetical protein [Clostridioides sp.]